MKNGVVFSIEEFSIYDGPGIRTTVFLKGCPLRCMWCHSPEGQSFAPEILRSPNGCLSCGACLEKGLEITGEKRLVKESINVCPKDLIREAGTVYAPDELVGKILKNARILQKGGGVTFSGGEPLSQADFLTDCLSRLEGRIHRAIQTSGYATEEVFDRVLALCDYVLFDLKLIDDKKHRYYCGQSNELILKNYRALARSGKEFITRIPLIPTVNDTVDNLSKTAELMDRCGVRRVELLPYHKLTGSKYAMTGRVYAPEFDENIPPCPHLEIFEKHDIEVSVL